MPFSRTCKVLEKEHFSKWLWEILDFCLGKFYNIIKWIKISVVLSTAYVMFFHFIIYYIKYDLRKKS